jgi:hypothetical protein
MRGSKPVHMAARFMGAVGLLLLLAAYIPGEAYASGSPARTETLAVGPYRVDVNLYQDPPITDRPVKVTVVPHDAHLWLSGFIIVLPGLGTDAVPIPSALTRVGQTYTLAGTIHMPVRGAWEVQVQLDGPRGQGEAVFPITVAAPGATPVWLAWVIGLSPLLVIVWLTWHQSRYRRVLLLQRSTA